MSKEIEIYLPKLGESIVGATIVQWFKKEGDQVQLDEALLEVSTDKVNSEIPSPASGVIKKIVALENEEVEVGQLLLILEVGAPMVQQPAAPAHVSEQPKSQDASSFLTPAVLNYARLEQVSLQELSQIRGSGDGGRISKKDVEEYVRHKREKAPAQGQRPPPSFSASEDKRTKMVGIRKAIADVMIRSHNEIPHAALVQEVDVTNLLSRIAASKEQFMAEHRVKLTLTSYLIRALALSLQRYPYLNASVEGDTIVTKSPINIGFAVALEHDGILVPVLHGADRLSIPQIAQKLTDLTQRARAGSLNHEEVKGGTVTLTNFGMTGVTLGFPIIRHPEVAILGIGAVQKKLIVTPEEHLVIRSQMHVTLSFDHRVVDGLYGCAFLNEFSRQLS